MRGRVIEIGEYHLAVRCHHSRWGRKCRRPLVGSCQYCAEGFCAEHGERFGDNEEVCAQIACQTKKHDLQAHVEFRAEARERNASESCGHPECANGLHSDCQRCEAHYCVVHLQQLIVTVSQQGEQGPEMLRICLHCVERISIWEQR